jgi:2,3-bisphosphoglycerate-dependent phosphoglycerate mutase
MRHGQSMWNAADLFTGWVDVPLSKKGIEKAISSGTEISEMQIDEIHTSTLIRAQMTAMIVMAQHSSAATPVFQYDSAGGNENQQKMNDWAQIRGDVEEIVPVYVSWKLNERMYGNLQGLNKTESRAKWGDEQIHIWRRSYDTPPPEGESLELTAARTIPYLQEVIMPSLSDGNCIFITAHGNSLRSIIMHLDDLSREEVLSLEVPTGRPIIYEMVDGKLQRK